jgi:hypothetical protein
MTDDRIESATVANEKEWRRYLATEIAVMRQDNCLEHAAMRSDIKSLEKFRWTLMGKVAGVAAAVSLFIGAAGMILRHMKGA